MKRSTGARRPKVVRFAVEETAEKPRSQLKYSLEALASSGKTVKDVLEEIFESEMNFVVRLTNLATKHGPALSPLVSEEDFEVLFCNSAVTDIQQVRPPDQAQRCHGY
jgi:hypothetical protein